MRYAGVNEYRVTFSRIKLTSVDSMHFNIRIGGEVLFSTRGQIRIDFSSHY